MLVLPESVTVPVTDKSPSTVKFVPTPKVEDKVVAPETFAVPSIITPSFILILEESSLEIVVPENFNEPAMTFPVPAGDNTKSEFEAVALI